MSRSSKTKKGVEKNRTNRGTPKLEKMSKTTNLKETLTNKRTRRNVNG
jgi:hypothetical protein